MFNKKLICKEIEKCGLAKEIKIDELMKFHTSWKIGGIADFFCIPADQEKLINVLLFGLEHDLPIHIIGNGSNILVSDKGIRGLVVKISGTLDKIEYSDKMIKVGAGILLPALVRKMVEKELSGLEFASHIPGTLGGAIMNNASFGTESIASIVKKISIFDYNGNLKELDKDQFAFIYRGIDLDIKKFIILDVYLDLVKEDKNRIISKIKKFYHQREASQPIEHLTAGCIFKNPKMKPAGYLIEKSGAKGLMIGDAQISEKHANFIINRGKATSKDILGLMEEVKKRVEKNFGIALEREISIIG
jgi:UDP-N-acetylmuramate dehydrogenase